MGMQPLFSFCHFAEENIVTLVCMHTLALSLGTHDFVQHGQSAHIHYILAH